MNRIACLFLFVVVLTACRRQQTPDVQWRGEGFHQITSLSGLPTSIQEALGVRRPGVEGIADAGGSFNVTDVVDESLPMRRFTIAGVSNNHAVVAIERGGRAHFFEIFLFELPGTEKERWAPFEKAPISLRSMLESLPNKP